MSRSASSTTTRTSTGDVMNAHANGLPDAAALARLVSELFDRPPPTPTPPRPPPPAPRPPPARPPLARRVSELCDGPDQTLTAGAPAGTPPAADGRPGAPAAEPAGSGGFTVDVPRWGAAVPSVILPQPPGGAAAGAATPEVYFTDPSRHGGTAGPRGPWGGPFPPDADVLRRDFPILAERVNGHPLVWLDNAATTHKPQEVIDRLVRFYTHENSNIHRADHELAARATDAYEDARATVASFLGAPSGDDIVFVRGTTEH